jgi:enoyl-CoA hydratase
MTDHTDTSTDEAPVLVSVDARVATVTLNRPRARNALSSELIQELRWSLRELDRDDDVDVIVLTGSDPAFCAGLDLKELGSTGGNLDLLPPEGGLAGTPFAPVRKPLIGAVNGVAVTGGLELALHCDILIASVRARFADTHARVGVMPAWGLTVLLPQAVGARVARQMSLTGDYLDADDALRHGLVTAVVPHDELLDHVRKVAASIVGNDQAGVRTLLSTYRTIAQQHDAAAVDVELEASRSSLARGFDPAAVEQRRAGILSRGRDQVGGSAR